jgi:DNA-binding beta-propeller fold protein YncE
MTEQDVWTANKRAILTYVPSRKDLKLIWERDPKTERIISRFQSLRQLGTEDSMSFSFGGRTRTFYILNIPNNNIRQFQRLVKTFPTTPATPPAPVGFPLQGVASMFEGGKGTEDGNFDSPTGIAVDGNGNVFVADTGNGRIEKFSSTGNFIASMGQFEAPGGIAIDRGRNIYVAEIGSKHRVQKLTPDGKFIAEWKGPGLGFYGPRRIAIGPDDSVYVVDQGQNRIVKFSPDGQMLASWGTGGSGDGQFNDPTSVSVDTKTNRVYVADPRNKRIQIFNENGKFLTKWSVPEWGEPTGFEDLVVDSQIGRLYASSAHLNSVLVFDINGTRIGSLMPKPPERLQGPSALALLNGRLYIVNMFGNRVTTIDL